MSVLDFESLQTRFDCCCRLSDTCGVGARQLLDVLRRNGGTVLQLAYGPEQQAPEEEIDKEGCIIMQPGLAHPLLRPDPHPWEGKVGASCSFGYLHGTRTFRFSQYGDPQDAKQTDAVMQGQLALALVLYPELHPVYGSIDEAGENRLSGKIIKSQELKYLFWANFYGPAYVERYGRDFLLGAPGWRKEELDDGGVLYVVDESYMHWRTTEATRAVRYFQLKVPAIRQYRSRGFGRSEALLEGRLKPKRRRRNRE